MDEAANHGLISSDVGRRLRRSGKDVNRGSSTSSLTVRARADEIVL